MIYIIGGVSGVGKTTVAKALATRLSMEYIDADNFHPNENISKMANGKPLTDKDRQPWLESLNIYLRKKESGPGVVLACSALKEVYRKTLHNELTTFPRWIFLTGHFELIQQRMQDRNHFMPAKLLQSQFDTLELPNYGLMIEVSKSPNEIVEQIIQHFNNRDQAEVGLIGLGVMGKSLSRNIASKGFRINVFNRHLDSLEEAVAEKFVAEFPELNQSKGFDQLEPFVASLAQPRKIILMIPAGEAVDQVLNNLKPLLDAGDIIMDGGNSHFKDSQNRFDQLSKSNIHFLGTGISGGELGALEGPSIMPGGSAKAFAQVEQVLLTIAAKDHHGKPCCTFIGEGGAGHFVKMVHNGIEYAEMQLIAETYGVLRFAMKKTPDEIANIFEHWTKTESASYLLEITIAILRKQERDRHLLDLILDKAGNKGTGSWTTVAACELGVAIPTITAALFARYQSAEWAERQLAADQFEFESASIDLNLEMLRAAFQQARIINHHQGFDLIAKASTQFEWQIDQKKLAQIWCNGCIIRSKFMERISEHKIDQQSILLNAKLNYDFFEHPKALQTLISAISRSNISAPCYFSSLSYFNGFRERNSLANMIQAQRDYFGAHRYERRDAEPGQKFHTEWK